ncbi:hypothetical protein P152DRAFT_460971 [Eremomyces bilateralis CBS 781.70]|uniref:Uncharacterized protein n=1 Tax=Eremomyces bilateralis CBS 781.70 TaxID=1392243 RepID=A0A6G1FVS2_9PEZI|nr:uncharacterized protein P152DRAFT_460971 [Eremomyces bilateralis CBS 781.70]KAF1809873.1 hypothetical protein P152DRAFT_460971 [Eremomyces bilateralis CBS 781.70]
MLSPSTACLALSVQNSDSAWVFDPLHSRLLRDIAICVANGFPIIRQGSALKDPPSKRLTLCFTNQTALLTSILWSVVDRSRCGVTGRAISSKPQNAVLVSVPWCRWGAGSCDFIAIPISDHPSVIHRP